MIFKPPKSIKKLQKGEWETPKLITHPTEQPEPEAPVPEPELPLSKTIAKEEKELAKWEGKEQREVLKAKPSRPIPFEGKAFEPADFSSEEIEYESAPGVAFDMDDWEAHAGLEDFDYKTQKKIRKAISKGKLMPRFHHYGPDGKPIVDPIQRAEQELEAQ